MKWLGIFALLLTFDAQAARIKNKTAENCIPFYQNAGGLHFYRQYFAPDDCYLSVNPDDTINMIFRSYLTTNEGLFMVFNSYGPGNDAERTGARSYYFFPRGSMPEVAMIGNILKVAGANPLARSVFDVTTGKLTDFENAEVTIDPNIVVGNAGGVEIKKFKGLMLDLGFAKGHDPVTEKDRPITFTDHTGQTCIAKVRDVFVSQGGEIKLISDSAIKTFLAARCPGIKTLF